MEVQRNIGSIIPTVVAPGRQKKNYDNNIRRNIITTRNWTFDLGLEIISDIPKLTSSSNNIYDNTYIINLDCKHLAHCTSHGWNLESLKMKR